VTSVAGLHPQIAHAGCAEDMGLSG
jgi:hypothetical protein